MRKRVVIDESPTEDVFSAEFTAAELVDTTVLPDWVVWDDEIERYVVDDALPIPEAADYDDLFERMEEDYEETIAAAMERGDKGGEIALTPGVAFDDGVLIEMDLEGDEGPYGKARDWALTRDQRRALGLASFARAKGRLTDREPGRPRATAGIAHDQELIRTQLISRATEAGMSFAEFIAPFPPGKPTPAARARRHALARAVSELRQSGATVEAIASVINRAPARVSELGRGGLS